MNMKILIDPALAVLIKDFSDEQCAELLRCIFEYPNRDSDLGVWKYMKKQIEKDEQKYKEKCMRLSLNRACRTGLNSILKSQQKSSVEEEKEENKNINIKILKGSERRNAQKIVENSVENAEMPVENISEFPIDENFTFDLVIQCQPKFKDYLAMFPPSVIETAQKTLKKKRKGQWINMAQLLDWIEKQHAFYKSSQEG